MRAGRRQPAGPRELLALLPEGPSRAQGRGIALRAPSRRPAASFKRHNPTGQVPVLLVDGTAGAPTRPTSCAASQPCRPGRARRATARRGSGRSSPTPPSTASSSRRAGPTSATGRADARRLLRRHAAGSCARSSCRRLRRRVVGDARRARRLARRPGALLGALRGAARPARCARARRGLLVRRVRSRVADVALFGQLHSLRTPADPVQRKPSRWPGVPLERLARPGA